MRNSHEIVTQNKVDDEDNRQVPYLKEKEREILAEVKAAERRVTKKLGHKMSENGDIN